jgi:benzoate membrane transport protein
MSRPQFLQPVVAGCVAAFVGFVGSFAVIVQGLTAAGGNSAQAGSGLMAASIAMGLAGLFFSFRLKEPVSAAWSTPAGALLASTGAIAGGWPAVTGAFLLANALLIAAGLVKPLGRAVAAIPGSIASAMLAGILFSLCLSPVKAFLASPVEAAIVVLVWLAALRWRRVYATPAAAIAAALIIWRDAPGGGFHLADLVAPPVLVWPQFSVGGFASVALPVFIVTMASQNLPSIAVLRTYGYKPSPSLTIVITGLFGFLAAPFGGPAVNLSAITAAMTASPEASPDPARRWIATASMGVVYVLLGICAGAMMRLVSSAPLLIEAVAGLALLGPLGASLHNALSQTAEREAALATFLVAASGVSFHGIGGAFWGLLAGGAVLAITRAGASPRPPARPA